MLSWFRARPRKLGEQGEAMAARFLRAQGYAILARNLRLGRYEVDIVAREGDTIAFVEVKTRRYTDIAAPEQSVTLAKQRHLAQAARLYRANHPNQTVNYRFDVVSILLPERGDTDITLFRDAFRVDG